MKGNKKIRKPLKSLMLTAMALLTAAATAVNATSYVTIRVEHIWEDNNNAFGTRPNDVVVDITQIKTDEDGNDQVTKEDFSTMEDDGSNAGKEAGAASEDSVEDLLEEAAKRGEEAGVQAGADVKNQLDNLGVTPPEDLTQPGDLVNPDDLQKVEDLKDYTGEDGNRYQYNEDEKAAYQEKLDEYRKAYEAYQGSENEPGAYETYQEAYKEFLDYLKEYSKAENSAPLPGGNDDGFMKGFLEGFENGELTADQLKEAYENAFNKGYDNGYSGEATPPVIEGDDRDQLVDEIGNKIDQLVDGTGTDTAEEILDTVNKIISDTAVENMWFTEEELSAGDEKDENGDPLNYQAEMAAPVETNKDFLKDTLGLDDEALASVGYTTKQLKIEIKIVGGRIYASVDGGNTFVPANAEAEAQAYDPTADVLEEVTFTFLHTLNVPYTPPVPGEPSRPEPPEPPKATPKPTSEENDGTPPPPTNFIPEDEVPLAKVEEEEGVEDVPLPDENIPLTDVPKTGDASFLWMCVAMFSGMALVVLTKQRREETEAV